MLYWLIILVGFLVLLVLSQYMLKFLRMKNIKINRFIWAFAAFLIVMVPKAIFPHMGELWSVVLYGLCGIFGINFMSEQHHWVTTSKYFKYKN